MEYYSKYTGQELDELLDKIKADNVGVVDSALSLSSENPVMNKVVTEELNNKQENIDDLEVIREGAAKGATAIQKVKTVNGESIVGVGNIEIKGDEYPIDYGEAENSARLKGEYKGYSNRAISQTSVALGAGVAAGLKGWYYSNIDFANNQIVLSDKQPYVLLNNLVGGSWSSGTPDIKVGDKISVVNDSKYDFCGEVMSIDANIITLKESLPFDDLALSIISVNNLDDWSIYLPERPDAGVVDFGGGAFAEGALSKASNICSHSEGLQTHSYGQYSHAEGRETKAGYASHAEGKLTIARGEQSHAEGNESIASGNNSHAEGKLTVSDDYSAHTEGYGTVVSADESQNPTVNENASNAAYSHAEGNGTLVRSHSSHAEGRGTIVTGHSAHAEGLKTLASGNASHAEGNKSTAEGSSSHAEGIQTKATNTSAHAEGSSTIASGADSHAEGRSSEASGNVSHAEGRNTKAKASMAHAEGDATEAGGVASHAEGVGTITTNKAEHACGMYNLSYEDIIFSVGIGTGDTKRQNALHIYNSGEIYIRKNNAPVKLQDYVGDALLSLYSFEELSGGRMKRTVDTSMAAELRKQMYINLSVPSSIDYITDRRRLFVKSETYYEDGIGEFIIYRHYDENAVHTLTYDVEGFVIYYDRKSFAQQFESTITNTLNSSY